MSIRSLRFRLLSAALLSTLVVMVLAGLGLSALFRHHLERRYDVELETVLAQLIGRIEMDDDGRVHVTGTLADPRFDGPLSGLYWQIQDDTRPTLLRSRSLWDNLIDLPLDQLSLGDVHRHDLPGPAGQRLMVRERQIIVLPDTLSRRLRVAVARDRGDLDTAVGDFTTDMVPYLARLALMLLGAGWFQVRTGLAPLDLVRRGVYAIRSGRDRRLGGPFPDEVTPLVEEINGLLQARDAAVEKARAWTADLAHGLKTPLSALGADAQRLRDAGQAAMADDLDHLAQAMRRRVDRELIRARLRSAGPDQRQHADLGRVIGRVLNTLRRTPQGAHLEWSVRQPNTVAVALREDDLTELLGNLLDNAVKWADRQVQIQVGGASPVEVRIEDDGPGVADAQLGLLGQRGVRLDERTHGHGLGLAIAHDIVEAYGGQIAFARSALGGLAVILQLARAPDDRTTDT